MKSPATAACLALCMVLSACATLNETECRSANWHAIGQRDGAEGMRADRLNDHREACAEYGIRPDPQAYMEGRDLGLRHYCVLDNAVREGLAGRTYQGVCPPSIGARFADLNRAAHSVYEAREEVERLDRRQESLERELRNDKTSNERRKEIRDTLRGFDRKIDRARDDLRYKEIDLNRVIGMTPR